MQFKEILKKMLHSYFVVTTGIVFSIYLYCLLFNPAGIFTKTDIGRILLLAFYCALTYIVFYSKRELVGIQLIVREIICFILITFIVLFCSDRWEWINLSSWVEILFFLLVILVVRVIVILVTRYRDKKMTNKINDKLKERYHS